MANGVQLATAYISLNVRTDGIKKQVESALNGTSGLGSAQGMKIGRSLSSGIAASMGSIGFGGTIFAKLEANAKTTALRIGSMMATAIRGALATTGVGLGLAGLGGIAGVLTSGLERMKVKQAATVQLSLILNPAEIKKVTQDIQNVVDGIPVSMDQAMASVPKAVQAGIDPAQWVRDIANAAASSGGTASYEQVSLVMGQVIGKGKLLTEEMQQLAESGVDVRYALKQTFGWDDKTLQKNIEKGKVGIDQLRQAIQNTWGKNGGLAKQMNQTISGATGSLKAQIAKLGENFLGAIFGDPNDPNSDPAANAAKGIVKITDGIKGMTSWVVAHKADIHGFFTKAGDIIGGVGSAIGKVIGFLGNMKNAATDVGNWFTRTWDNITGAVGRAGDKIKTVFDTVKTKISDIVDDLEKRFESIFGENGWFAQQFKKLGELVDKVREVLGLGPAKANASPAPNGAVPFNPGPMAPGAFGNYPGRSGLAPGTPLDGSDQGLVAVPNAVPGVIPGGFNQGAILGRVPAGRYVTADEFKIGDPKTLGDLTLGLGDCTSAIEDLVNMIEGKPTAGRSMWTGTADAWAAEHGFIPTDKPVPGTFQIGFNSGHMQATLPNGDAFNWGSDAAARQRGLDGGQGAWFDGATKHYYKKYSSGGRVWGAGSATSDSIPAMLSNGEHVLTADDVKKLGGQNGVYAFRRALQDGMIPGFAPGGSVDPTIIQDTQNQLADAQVASELAQAQFNEVMNNADATEQQKLQAEINLRQALRNFLQLSNDAPIIAAGGTPPDRSLENQITDSTDQLKLAQLQLANLPEDASYSQKLQAQAAVDQAQRARDQGIAAYQQKNAPTSFLDEFTRAGGFLPTAASNTGIAGTSSLAGVINMGNDVVSGLIDTGASLAQTAVTAAATAGAAAGTSGAGAIAGPAAGAAASWGIQTAANVGKRLSSYGFQLASIGADSLVAQMFPFGAPRWIGYDYTQFAPQVMMQAATTTIEKMGAAAIQRHFGQQNGFQIPDQPVAPSPASPEAPIATPQDPGPQPLVPTQGLLQKGDPGFIDRTFDPNNLTPGGGGGSWAKGGAIRIYDDGGVLRPGDLALNASTRPEKILTQKQWDSLGKIQPAGRDAPLVKIDAIYGMSPDDVANKIEAKQKLAMMRYAGRP